jgi:Subunit ChlI of Mg-chelatase
MRQTVRGMLAAVASATLNGALGRPVSVEVHVSNGCRDSPLCRSPDAAVREARDRERAAVLSSGPPWPLRRVTVNLAPSGVSKAGAGLDLPIAVGLLVASGFADFVRHLESRQSSDAPCVPVVFVRKSNFPRGGGLATHLAKHLDTWARDHRDPYVGAHWP